MCGIAGICGDGDIKKMVEILSHRGPDEEGYYEDDKIKLGVRRLAIIDLKKGSQPIYNENKTIVVIFNGMIFNYKELRKELEKTHQFYTESDTEVIVHAFEEYGIDCVKKFNGMFAIAIWDKEKLYLIRDRLGEKPLFYYFKNNLFLFASEIKSILTQIKAYPNLTEAFQEFDTPVEEETIFKDIYSLNPGSILIYDGNKILKYKYWEIQQKESTKRKESDYIEELRYLIEDSIKLRMISDVPTGLFLSGGIDSALIACISKPQHLFSANFPLGEKFDELKYAKIVAKHIGANHHIVTPTSQDLKNQLPKIIWYLDQPVSTASSIAEFALANLAKKYVKVVLGGQGADELFGGYIRYLLMLEEEHLFKNKILKNYHSLMRYFWRNDMFDDFSKRYFHLIRRGDKIFPKEGERIKSYFSNFNNLIDQMGYCDIKIFLPSLLTMNDRGAASVGLENRSPFLDHRIVEFAFSLPKNLKIRGYCTKYILKKVAKGIVPDVIIKRKDKKGLVVPFNKWLKEDLKEWSDSLIDSLKKRIPLNIDSARGEFDRKKYNLVTLELWFRTFIDNEIKDEIKL